METRSKSFKKSQRIFCDYAEKKLILDRVKLEKLFCDFWSFNKGQSLEDFVKYAIYEK